MTKTWQIIVGALLTTMIRSTQPVGAQVLSDYEAVRNHVTCYPFGADKIGRGDFDAGLAVWKQCFSKDFHFTLSFGHGEPMTCPGSNCPFPKEMSGVEIRAALTKRSFNASGYQKTSRHLTNVTVNMVSADHATVNAYLQAWHWKADGTVLLGAGTWDVEVAKTASGWRIANEKLSIVGSGSLTPPVR